MYVWLYDNTPDGIFRVQLQINGKHRGDLTMTQGQFEAFKRKQETIIPVLRVGRITGHHTLSIK